MGYMKTLISYYKVHKPEDTDWMVLPKITVAIIQRSEMSHGTGRFRVLNEFL